jgi:hypothetical protein
MDDLTDPDEKAATDAFAERLDRQADLPAFGRALERIEKRPEQADDSPPEGGA